jgi:hypothetical protein
MALIIKNREEIIEQLTDLLVQFGKDCNSYQTDVYLYYNEEEQTATLDTFLNVGGNSWLDDEHYNIYSDKEHFDSMWDWYCNVEELAEYIGIPIEQLCKEVIEYLELDEDEAADYEIDYREAEQYIGTKDEYMDKLKSAYDDYIDESRADYMEQAENIMERFDEVVDEEEI